MPDKKPRIFISYARDDGESFARTLRESLTDKFGEDEIWQDRTEMEGGIGWWQQITQALDNVEFMVLVATPKAMASPIVKKEWRYARQQGVCVYPVQVPEHPIDFGILPRWMADSHFYDLETPEQNEKFYNDLNTKCTAPRVAFYGVPDLPVNFVQRPEVFEQMKTQLLDEARDNPVAITTSLVGAGGFGKTTLASALCHDEDIQQAFDEGILWVTLGENPNLLRIVNDMVLALTGEKSSYETVTGATSALAEKLADNDILLVIDDIWDSAHIKPFVQGGERCARLMTTRFSNIATGANALTNDVDEMTTAQSVDLLLGGIEPHPTDIKPFETLAERLGEWALMLEIANGMLREAIDFGDDVTGALAYVNELLDEEGIIAVERETEDERNRSAESVLSASFRQLKDDETSRLFELAIFVDDSEIPLTTVSALWDIAGARVRKQMTRFARYSFVRLDAETQTIRLHDVVREVLQLKLEAEQTPSDVHGRLIDNFGELTDLPDDYAWRNLAYHLTQADKLDTLRELLLTFHYLQNKLNATDPNALITDCDYIQDDRPIALVQSALSMSAHITEQNPERLFECLSKHLAGYNRSFIELDNLFNYTTKTELVPIHPTFSDFQPAGGALIRTLEGHTKSVQSVVISDDFAISTSEDETLKVWNWRTGEHVRTLEGHTGDVTSVAVSDDFAISVSYDKTLKVWNWKTGEHVRTLEAHTEDVTSVAVQSDIAITASSDKTLKVWNWKTGEHVRTLEAHTEDVTSVTEPDDYALFASVEASVAISNDYVISVSWSKTLEVWNWQTGEQVRILQGHKDFVTSVAISDAFAISGSWDKTLKVWNWKTDEQVRTLEAHAQGVTSVAISDDFAISASEDETLKVWNWRTGEQVRTLEAHAEGVTSVAISDDYAISASEDDTLKVWNWRTGEHVRTLEGHTQAVDCVAISDDYAISASTDETLKVWNWRTGEHVRTLEGHNGNITSVAISNDLAISASDDTTLKVWNWKTGEHVRTFEAHAEGVTSVAISDDFAISASWGKTLKVWNWTTGEHLRTLEGHSDYVHAVKVLGKFAISVSGDALLNEHGTLKVWNWNTGECLYTFDTDYALQSIAIAPDFECIIVGDENGGVHFLRPNEALKKLLRGE